MDHVMRSVHDALAAMGRKIPIEGYDVYREIGRGGQAVVYLARRQKDGLPVAIKVMPDTGVSTAFRRLQAEAAVLRRLQHPNIVACHEVFRDELHCHLVMDYVPGVSLSVLLDELARRRASTGSLKNMLKMLAKVCDALHAAHEAGVIHRDIKPPNVRIDDDGTPFLLDFGLASVADESAFLQSMHTADRGHFVGTMFWASPEQIRGETASPASDLWSLGLILHQVVTANAPPYQANRGLATAIADAARGRVHLPPGLIPAVGELGPGCEDATFAVLRALLAPKPEQRPESAAQVARDLKLIAAGAADAGTVVRRRGTPGRRWSSFAGMGAILATAMAGWWLTTGGPSGSAKLAAPIVLGEVRLVGGYHEVLMEHGLIFRWIPPGTATLGTDPDRPREWWIAIVGDSPLRPHVQAEGFWMLRFEVHQEAYEAIVGVNPSRYRDPNRPVERVSYHDAVAFCRLASEQLGVGIRLPTEVEWEYACRGGTDTIFSFGDDPALAARHANAADLSFPEAPDPAPYDDGHPHTAPKGRFLHNPFGLSDMHGNVWEWCAGPYESRPGDPGSAVAGRAGVRGGSFYDTQASLESAHRNPLPMEMRATTIGFRVIAELPPPP
jgi:formylglycine-generating enzyme required for sulfatase activity